MRNLINVSIIFLSVCNFSFCQKTEVRTLDILCDANKQFDLVDHKKKYPFDKSYKIKLITFGTFEPLDDTLSIEKITPLQKVKSKIDLKFLKNETELDSEKISELLTILFGYTHNGTYPIPILDSKCYVPRHAIVFYNYNNEPFEFIEICFNCEKIFVSSPKIRLSEVCKSQYYLLQKFFERNNIEVRIFSKPY